MFKIVFELRYLRQGLKLTCSYYFGLVDQVRNYLEWMAILAKQLTH